MSAKVIQWGGITKLDLEPSAILDKAKDAGLTGVVIIGYDSAEEIYAASSYADGGTILWLLEACKHELLKAGGVIGNTEDA